MKLSKQITHGVVVFVMAFSLLVPLGPAIVSAAPGDMNWSRPNMGDTGDDAPWSNVAVSDNGQVMVAAAEQEIYVSKDAGATWASSPFDTGQISSFYSVAISNDGSKIVTVDWDGSVYTSNDYGVTWLERTGAGSGRWSGVAMSGDGSKIAANADNGYLYTSNDSGATWTVRTGIGPWGW